MELKIVRYSNDQEEAWDHFINERAKNATFLHSRAFFAHNILNIKDDHSLLFYDTNKLIALLPANEYMSGNNKIFHSYMRSTYGGIIIDNKTGMVDLLEVTDQLKLYLIDNGFAEAIIRPSFRIYHTFLSDEIDYALWKTGFSVKYREVELAIALEADIEANYSSSTLRSVKKAVKSGVEVAESNDIETYWAILTNNLREKHDAKPVHTIEEIRKLMELVGAGKIKLFAASLSGRMVGGILVFTANKLVAHAQYIASDAAYQEYRPLNAVIDYIAKWSKQNGFKYFNLGMATEPGGSEVNAGLFKFKEGFGARCTLRETMHLSLNN